MSSKAFNDGFKDAREGREWRADDYGYRSLCYERGRQLAVASPELISIKSGRRVSRHAAAECYQLYKDKTIL